MTWRRPVNRDGHHPLPGGAREMLAAWDREPEVVDESRWTRGAEPGWRAWNDMSPELEFCELVAAIARLARPASAVETGVGQGFVTRRLVAAMPPGSELACFEEWGDLREALRALAFWGRPGVRLADEPTPPDGALARADLVVLDSGWDRRFAELDRWWAAGKPGSLVVVHDAKPGRMAGHSATAAKLRELGVPGTLLPNPRGSFLGRHP